MLLLAANQPDLFAEDARPEWVTSWLAKRDQSAARRATRTEKADKPVDAAAQAKRARQRVDRVAQGLEALDLWMADLVRQGLASVETQGLAPWHEQARRLVDAQAPGLAARVRALAEIPRATRDWPERLLGELGKIALVTHAFRRLDQLPPGRSAGMSLTELALVGTARHPQPPASDTPVDGLVGSLGELDAERRALLTAGLAAMYRRAGRRAGPAFERPQPAPPDSQQSCTPRAENVLRDALRGGHLDLLPEFSARLQRRGLRLPAGLLVEMLSAAGAPQTPFLAPILGARGRWLVGQCDAWR